MPVYRDGPSLHRDVQLPALPRVGESVLLDADEQEPVTVVAVHWQIDHLEEPSVRILLAELDSDVVADHPNAAIAALVAQGWSTG